MMQMSLLRLNIRRQMAQSSAPVSRRRRLLCGVPLQYIVFSRTRFIPEHWYRAKPLLRTTRLKRLWLNRKANGRGQKTLMSLLLPMLNSILFRSSCWMIQEARPVQPASIRFPGRFIVLTAEARWYAEYHAAEIRNMPTSSAVVTRATRPSVRLTASKNLLYMIPFSLSFKDILTPL